MYDSGGPVLTYQLGRFPNSQGQWAMILRFQIVLSERNWVLLGSGGTLSKYIPGYLPRRRRELCYTHWSLGVPSHQGVTVMVGSSQSWGSFFTTCSFRFALLSLALMDGMIMCCFLKFYLFLAVLGLHCCSQAFSSCGDYSTELQCTGFSFQWLFLLWSISSRLMDLSSCSMQPQ